MIPTHTLKPPSRIDLTAVQLAQLAREIAQDLVDLPTILGKHNITQDQYDFLQEHNAYFKSILASEVQAWQSIKSTEARIRLQAQAVVEEQMPALAARIGGKEKLSESVEAFKAISRIAGVDTPASGPVASGERYTINIDLGADTRIVIGGQPMKDITPELPKLEQT